MKRVLVVHFSQTGQLARVARRLVSPLAEAGDVELVEEVLRPHQPYPFPWPAWRFLDVMPETVLLEPPELEPLSVRAEEPFDLIILAYQVWYLAPSGPITAFLKSEAGKRLLRGRPVVTVIACRNMWLVAQETVKQLIQGAGGRPRAARWPARGSRARGCAHACGPRSGVRRSAADFQRTGGAAGVFGMVAADPSRRRSRVDRAPAPARCVLRLPRRDDPHRRADEPAPAMGHAAPTGAAPAIPAGVLRAAVGALMSNRIRA